MHIVGHQKIINFLDKSIEKNAVSHAYIFSGPKHLGKFSMALDFARKLTGSSAEINPDIAIVRPDIRENKGISKEGDIKIDKIREFIHQLSVTSYSGKCKIGIIDGAEKMNRSAQNSLLKSLEEPMDNVVIILVTCDLEKLLPTVKSRCILKRFYLVSEAEIEGMLPSGINGKKNIIFWSLGRPGLLKELVEKKEKMNKIHEAERELLSLFSFNMSEKIDLAEKASKDVPALIEKLNWWLVCLRNNMIGKKETVLLPQDKLLKLSDKMEKSIETMRETNSNPRLVLENLFFEF